MGGAITLTGNTNTELEMTYAAAKKRAEPYTKIVEELPTMRREAVQLVRQAVGAGRVGARMSWSIIGRKEPHR
jgi:hypothetical protein